MNLTQTLIIIGLLFALNLLWSLKSNNIESNDQNNSTEIKKEKSIAEKSFYTVILLIPFILCLWMTNIWFEAYNKSMQAINWEKVTGIVLDKRVGDIVLSGTDVNNNVRGSNFKPYIEYEYTLNGVEYSSSRISYLKLTEYYEDYDVEKYLEQFPAIGEKITIHAREYKTKFGINKSESTLKVGTDGIEYMGVMITSIICILCLAGFRALYF